MTVTVILSVEHRTFLNLDVAFGGIVVRGFAAVTSCKAISEIKINNTIDEQFMIK